jgi:hypothetical protein
MDGKAHSRKGFAASLEKRRQKLFDKAQIYLPIGKIPSYLKIEATRYIERTYEFTASSSLSEKGKTEQPRNIYSERMFHKEGREVG